MKRTVLTRLVTTCHIKSRACHGMSRDIAVTVPDIECQVVTISEKV